MYYTTFKSEIGPITLVGDENGLQRLFLDKPNDISRRLNIGEDWIKSETFFKTEILWVNAYLSGSKESYDIKLNPQGTAFQKRVWKALLEIPYGETISYMELAKRIGNENASRAVGAANGKNPIPLIIPCHRVIGKNGKLTGFALGLDVKQHLLSLEGCLFEPLMR